MSEKTKINSKKFIKVVGSREHNLKNISVNIPKEEITVITGLSGSGKSSLAFDTIYAEGQRRYVESLSAYARQFLEMMQKPLVPTPKPEIVVPPLDRTKENLAFCKNLPLGLLQKLGFQEMEEIPKWIRKLNFQG